MKSSEEDFTLIKTSPAKSEATGIYTIAFIAGDLFLTFHLKNGTGKQRLRNSRKVLLEIDKLFLHFIFTEKNSNQQLYVPKNIHMALVQQRNHIHTQGSHAHLLTEMTTAVSTGSLAHSPHAQTQYQVRQWYLIGCKN